MSSRIKTVEQTLDRVEVRQEKQDDKLELATAKQEKVNTEFQERLRKLELNSGSGVVRELDDRMDKQNNLVVHRVPESTSVDSKERQGHDAAIIKVLMKKYLDIKGMDTDSKLRFIKRLGDKVEGAEARPILLGLKFTSDLELVLDRSWMLSRCDNKAARDINIVKDLTSKQRQRESDLVSEAGRKNMERSHEEVEENIVFKVVGRKGEKREIKVTLRHGEKLDESGNVVREDGWNKGNRSVPNKPLVTGGNREPVRPVATAGQGSSTVGGMGKGNGREDSVENSSKELGDWECEQAAGKRGRQNPSPDKVMKKVRPGEVVELKNRFQQMAEGLFRAQDMNLV